MSEIGPLPKKFKYLAAGDLISLESGRDDGADVDADLPVDVHAVEEAVARPRLKLDDPFAVAEAVYDANHEEDLDHSGLHFFDFF